MAWSRTLLKIFDRLIRLLAPACLLVVDLLPEMLISVGTVQL